MEEPLSMSSISESVDSGMPPLLNASEPVSMLVLVVAVASPLRVLPGWGLCVFALFWMTEDAFLSLGIFLSMCDCLAIVADFL